MTNRTRSTLKFSGRVPELETLIARWRMACNMERPGSQVVVIKAEPGLGKTRLALEFYRWLNENDPGWLTKRYWPDALEIIDDKIQKINPEPRDCNLELPIPYLWWGLRALKGGDAVANYDRYLYPHLVALLYRDTTKNRGLQVLKAWKDVGLDLLSSYLLIDTFYSVGKGLFETSRIVFDAAHEAPLESAKEHAVSRAAAALSYMEKVFRPGTMVFAKTAGIIFLDDAHFVHEDAALPVFVERLMHTCVTQQWPILIIVTHWKAELSTDLAESERSFAGILRHGREGSPTSSGPAAGLPGGYLTDDNFAEIDLQPLADLSDALREHLPGLKETQSAAILDRIGGNPLFLEQVIGYLLQHKYCFDNGEPAEALSDEGFRQTLTAMESRAVFEFVLGRLQKMPQDVQEAICLASIQGVHFVNGLVEALGRRRWPRNWRIPTEGRRSIRHARRH